MAKHNQVCAKCNSKIISHCTKPDCVEWREEVARKIIQDCFATLGSSAERLASGNEAGTGEDYREVKKIEKKVDELIKERKWKGLLIQADLENLKKSCQELAEEYISPKVRQMADSKFYVKQPCCVGSAIKLDEKDQEYYCDYCWERDEPRLLNNLRSSWIDELLEWRNKNNLYSSEASNLLSNFLNINFTSQAELKQTYQQVVQGLNKIAEQKGLNKIDTNSEDNNPNQQRKKEQIQQAINILENKPNKTPQEEQDLSKLKDQLKQSKPTLTNQDKKPTNYTFWLIGGGCLVSLIIILLLFRFKKSKSTIKT